MGNIDFALDAKFSIYTVFLLISGLTLLALSLLTPNVRQRILNFLIGAAMLGYGIYLGWIFDGGSYQLFWYVFVIPFVMIFRVVSALVAAKQPQSAPPVPQPMIPPTDAPTQEPAD